MKKRLTLFVLAIFISLNVFSQEKKIVVVFSAGESSPVGEFASGDANDETAGFAKSGVNFNATLSVPVWNKIGLIAEFISEKNQMDALSFDKQTRYYYYNSNLISQSTFTSWTCSSALIGFYGEIPMCDIDKWYFDYRLLGGFAKTSTPQMKIKISEGALVSEGIMQSESADAISYLLGFGFRRNICKSFCVRVGADYFSTKPKFADNTLTINNKNVVVYNSYAQPVNTFNLDLGIGYRF